MLSNQSLLNFFIEYWYVGVVLILILIYKIFKARIKGRISEISTALILRNLNRSNYNVINNVVLEWGDKTSQIDHIVISSFGIFVIEIKNQKGWILGSEHSEYWTQMIYKRKE